MSITRVALATACTILVGSILLGARSGHAQRAPSRALRATPQSASWPHCAGEAGLLAWSYVSATLAAFQESPRIIDITAERFAFTPSEISLRVGEEVEFRINSEDTAHGFRIAGTPVNRAIPKRGKGELAIRFRPERAGRYNFECNRMCGAGHNFMRGVVIVYDPRDSKASK